MKRSALELYIIFGLMERNHWGEILKYTQLTKSLTNVLHFWINFKKETDLSLILIISPLSRDNTMHGCWFNTWVFIL